MSVELTEAEHDAIVQAVGECCSHSGPVDPSLPHGCRDCDDIVRVAADDTVALIIAARVAVARREALLAHASWLEANAMPMPVPYTVHVAMLRERAEEEQG